MVEIGKRKENAGAGEEPAEKTPKVEAHEQRDQELRSIAKYASEETYKKAHTDLTEAFKKEVTNARESL